MVVKVQIADLGKETEQRANVNKNFCSIKSRWKRPKEFELRKARRLHDYEHAQRKISRF